MPENYIKIKLECYLVHVRRKLHSFLKILKKSLKTLKIMVVVNHQLSVDVQSKTLLVDNQPFIGLTKKEAQVLSYLAENKQKFVHTEQILLKFWECDSIFCRRSLDVYTCKLNKILAQFRVKITRVYGKGIRIVNI